MGHLLVSRQLKMSSYLSITTLGSKFPEVKDSIAVLDIQDAIIDGERQSFLMAYNPLSSPLMDPCFRSARIEFILRSRGQSRKASDPVLLVDRSTGRSRHGGNHWRN